MLSHWQCVRVPNPWRWRLLHASCRNPYLHQVSVHSPEPVDLIGTFSLRRGLTLWHCLAAPEKLCCTLSCCTRSDLHHSCSFGAEPLENHNSDHLILLFRPSYSPSVAYRKKLKFLNLTGKTPHHQPCPRVMLRFLARLPHTFSFCHTPLFVDNLLFHTFVPLLMPFLSTSSLPLPRPQSSHPTQTEADTRICWFLCLLGFSWGTTSSIRVFLPE